MKIIIISVLLLIVSSLGCIDEISDKTYPLNNEISDKTYHLNDEVIIKNQLSVIIEDAVMYEDIYDRYGSKITPEGAKLLMIYVRVENIAETKNTVNIHSSWWGQGDSNTLNVFYGDIQMTPSYREPNWDWRVNPSFSAYGYHYPGIVSKGWFSVEIPVNIEMKDLILKCGEYSWILTGGSVDKIPDVTPTPRKNWKSGTDTTTVVTDPDSGVIITTNKVISDYSSKITTTISLPVPTVSYPSDMSAGIFEWDKVPGEDFTKVSGFINSIFGVGWMNPKQCKKLGNEIIVTGSNHTVKFLLQEDKVIVFKDTNNVGNMYIFNNIVHCCFNEEGKYLLK